LVSSKQLTSFSDFRLPLTHSDHLTLEVGLHLTTDQSCQQYNAQEYVKYLQAYAEHFRMVDRIHLESKVVDISRDPGGGHLVSYVQKLTKSQWETRTSIYQWAKFND
jgi:dimethylaniline monooxygenase (N-oxide forming)